MKEYPYDYEESLQLMIDGAKMQGNQFIHEAYCYYDKYTKAFLYKSHKDAIPAPMHLVSTDFRVYKEPARKLYLWVLTDGTDYCLSESFHATAEEAEKESSQWRVHCKAEWSEI